MATFKRGLCDAFVEALNQQYDRKEAGWWSQFVDDKDLFLAIRYNAVHVYYRGCRLIEVEWRDGKVVSNTHYKYLLQPSMKKGYEYVEVVDGKPFVADANAYFFDRLIVAELKRSVKRYVGDEKRGVHDILQKNPHILDVEVAIGGGKGQIDFAALQEGKTGQTHIVFYEAKHFGNKELRSESGKIPVLEQIDRYRGLLEQHRASIVDGYRRVSENLCALNGVPRRYCKRHHLLQGTKDFIVEDDPGLAVFGFDGDQKSGRFWCPHRKKLEQRVRGERLLLYGKPKDVRVPTTVKTATP